jgi:ATP-binding cassette subfamily B (MDR/TAP) protein 1
MFIVNAFVFFIGAIFHRDFGLNASDMFTSILAIMYAAMGAGNNNQFMGDIGAAKNAAKNIFNILDRKDEF